MPSSPDARVLRPRGAQELLSHSSTLSNVYVVAECDAYTAVRQSHAELFAEFGGWLQFPRRDMSSAQLRALMQQPQPQVAAFLRACWQRRWHTPPDDVVVC